MADSNGLVLFPGNSNKLLAIGIGQAMKKSLLKAVVSNFSDGETKVEIGENIRGQDVFVIQSFCPPTVNEYLMEMLVMIDALKRASAKRITAVIPYYGYARQDRKVQARAPISAKLVADLLTASGANRVLTMELHAGQIQGFFNIPVDNLYAFSVLFEYIKANYQNKQLVIVSPDAGGTERARGFAKGLDATLAIIDKRRDAPNKAEVMNLIGSVKGKWAIIIDDMFDTFGTADGAVKKLMDEGAIGVSAAGIHPVLSGEAISRIDKSQLKEIIVTDTVPLRGPAVGNPKIKVLTVGHIFAEAISRIYNTQSISAMFQS